MANIAVVVPCYNVKAQIGSVLEAMPPCVARIFVVDDCCPEKTGEFVRAKLKDSRIRILTHEKNQGVGGAVMTGYKAAIAEGMDILVKIDGDGQMDPSLIENFVRPLEDGSADYAKGNRFWNAENLREMPRIRLFGNAVLSFINKISSGYWNIMDPTNGYTAITAEVVRELPFEKISRRYFFETDILFRLSTMRAVVQDIPMRAKYADEKSGLNIKKILFEFLGKHAVNAFKRIIYNYYIRDFSVASVELLLSVPLLAFGIGFGVSEWIETLRTGIVASSGTVMLAALPVFMGLELLLSFINYDIASVPKTSMSRFLRHRQ